MIALSHKPCSSLVVLAIFIVVYLQNSFSEAACPSIFFAQAIGRTKVATMDFYYTKTGVSTAAECANFCGLRQFCRTAVYNHDARTCALGYEVIAECSIIKQRYNTFHLTTDGADSLSVITCIDPCRKSSFGNIINSNENPKTLFSSLGKTDTVEKLPSTITSSETISTNFVPSSSNQPIIPVNHPLHISSGTSSFQMHGNGGTANLEPTQKQWKLATGHIQLEDPRLNGFLNAIQELHKVNEKVIHQEKDAAAGIQPESFSQPETHKKTVTFNGMPLHMQEYFNGASNAQQAHDSQLKKGKHEADSDNNSVISTFYNGSEIKVHTGGLFKWLKPGESIVIAPPELDSRNAIDNKLFQGQLPIELITANPGAFEKATRSEVKKTVTAASKIKVEEKEIGSKKKQEEDISLKKKSEKLRTPAREAYESGEPIVINGHILSAKEARELMAREETSSTTTTTPSPWHPAGLIGEESAASVEHDADHRREGKKKTAHTALQDDHGFLNTFVMQGLTNIMKGKDKSTTTIISNPSTSTTTTTPSTTTSSSQGSIICYRYVPQQRLLYAEFRKGRGVTLNECRCACAETWRNITTSSNKSDQKSNLCKSLSFNEETGECSLNRDDHTGKYDLIFDKKVDYHYVSCDIRYLLNAAAKMCSKSPAQKTEQDVKESIKSTLITSTTIATSTAQPSPMTTASTTTQTTTSESLPINASINEQQSEKTHGTILQQERNSKSKEDSVVKSAVNMQNFNKLIKEEEQEPSNKEETNILIAETTTAAPKLFNRKNISTNLTEPSSMLVSSRPIKMVELSTTSLSEMIMFTTTTTLKPESTTSTTLESKQTTPQTTTTQSAAVTNAKINGCFEIIEGYTMNNTAGGLERDVSMEECQCFCANSLSSERYSFQCTSATYYHKERDCVLNLGNRQLTPEIFVENDQQQKPANKLTYFGLICSSAKAIKKHVSQELANGCTPGSTKEEIGASQPVLKAAIPEAHTDQCFLELPNHVLEGTALAIETNVTVEECKCFCVDSEHRYGTECQSLQYYFDSQTCLLNKENRITDPDRFNYDPGSNVMHSYFDYKCHVEKVVLSAYIEQVCQMVIQISVKDVLNLPKTNPSLNIDDKSAEATKGVKPMDDTSKLKKIDDIDGKAGHMKSSKLLLTATNSSSKASTLSRKLRTTTSAPTTIVTTTTTPTTTTTTIAFEKLDSDSNENEENSDELKFESTTSDTTAILSSPTSSDKTQANTPKTTKSITIFKKNKKKKHKTIIPELEENEEEDMSSSKPAKTREKSRNKSEEQEEIDNETHNEQVSASIYTTSDRPETSTTTSTTSAATTVKLSTTTTVPPKTTTTAYPPVGPCRYSALYQTVFNGGRQLKSLMVTSPAQCFAACHAESCRSANLIQVEGTVKRCELFKDSIVEFRRTDVLSFDRGAVHFDSIQCDIA